MKTRQQQVGGDGSQAFREYAYDRARLDDIQRARLVAAMTDVAAEHGLGGATVARVVARAGVSRRTFYDLFADREQCYLAALDGAIDRAEEQVLSAYQSGTSWIERIRSGLAALLAFFDREPQAGQLLVISSLVSGAGMAERCGAIVGRLVAIVDGGRAESAAAAYLPPLVAEGVVGGALSIVHSRMLTDDRPLLALHTDLMSTIVMPYLGAAAARRELDRATPTPAAPSRHSALRPLHDLGARLTSHTVHTLLFIGQKPGSSNREIGTGIAISDQGQVSRLLSRLQRLGLIDNGGLRAKGAPNSWRLTEKGAEIERAVAVAPPADR